MTRLVLAAFLLVGVSFAPSAFAQASAPPNTANNFKDTSMIKPPAGARVAIIEFEDLECPACAHAFPFTRAAETHYHIPLEHYDFPLRMHIWSYDAAVTARYLQDKVSPQAAEAFRRTVFAQQTLIASKDDLQRFTQKYFQSHGIAMPFVMDPTGKLAQEVEKDRAFGEKVGLSQTPTIFVVTPKGWTQVTDVNYLDSTIEQALAQNPTPVTRAHR